MALWHLGDNFTSDIVVLLNQHPTRQLLLIRRKHEPFKGCWALPGGFVNSKTPQGMAFVFAETHLEAAVRELYEETAIVANPADFRLVGVYDAFGRDPRAEGNQRVVTQTFLYVVTHMPEVLAGDDASEACWFDLNAVLSGEVALAFDHDDMVRDAKALLS